MEGGEPARKKMETRAYGIHCLRFMELNNGREKQTECDGGELLILPRAGSLFVFPIGDHSSIRGCISDGGPCATDIYLTTILRREYETAQYHVLRRPTFGVALNQNRISSMVQGALLQMGGSTNLVSMFEDGTVVCGLRRLNLLLKMNGKVTLVIIPEYAFGFVHETTLQFMKLGLYHFVKV
uniref:Uncharacterized protein n=1 Tax=Oryza meridionalis TaxID=40149 RepID=A0A0E0DPG2_9ORYZ